MILKYWRDLTSCWPLLKWLGVEYRFKLMKDGMLLLFLSVSEWKRGGMQFGGRSAGRPQRVRLDGGDELGGGRGGWSRPDAVTGFADVIIGPPEQFRRIRQRQFPGIGSFLPWPFLPRSFPSKNPGNRAVDGEGSRWRLTDGLFAFAGRIASRRLLICCWIIRPGAAGTTPTTRPSAATSSRRRPLWPPPPSPSRISRRNRTSIRNPIPPSS